MWFGFYGFAGFVCLLTRLRCHDIACYYSYAEGQAGEAQADLRVMWSRFVDKVGQLKT